MSSLLKIVNRAAHQIAQQHISKAFSKALVEISKEEAKSQKINWYKKHSMNEHSESKENGCSCDICNCAQRINELRNDINYIQSYRYYVDRRHDPIDRVYLTKLQIEINECRNMRKRLMGFPERKRHAIPRAKRAREIFRLHGFVESFI